MFLSSPTLGFEVGEPLLTIRQIAGEKMFAFPEFSYYSKYILGKKD